MKRLGRLGILIVLLVVGIPVGLAASVLIGGMGLALMGTAVGIGPVGWIGIALVVTLAVYGVKALACKR